jgi:hypothetical protein
MATIAETWGPLLSSPFLDRPAAAASGRLLAVTTNESPLEQARRHVAEGESRVAAQERLLADLSRDGHDTTTAVELLATLRQSLAEMREHLTYEEQRGAGET